MENKHLIQQKLNGKSLIILMLPLVFMFFSLETNAQTPTIAGTGTSADVCGTCAPTGWANTGGTPDISNQNIAGGGNTLGAGATWVNAPLPLPPHGDPRWITMRDVGDFNNQDDENVTTTITGLTIGKLYKITVYVMSSFTNADGGTGNNAYYGGSYFDHFDYQIANYPRVQIVLNQDYHDKWVKTNILFVANATSMTLTIFPGDDAVTNSNAQNFEILHFSVDGVNAIERVDTDGDGVFDDEDIDDDNDGILDTVENGGNNPNADDDSDGIPNYLDTTGLTDNNNDGVPDEYDFDGDGIPNHLDLDSDNDGILDNTEAQASGASFIAFTATDTDMDGLVDVYDTTPNGNVDGSGSIGITPIDTDTGTGFDDNPDYLDIDSDQDGIPDIIEAQTTLGYTAPTGDVGANGVDSAYENVDTYSPVALTPVNTDNSDNQDYRDLDSDNDGTSDLDESGLGNVISNSDGDGDGLNNNHDNTDTNDVSNFDATNGITTPSSAFTDIDTDVNSGGDVDYRDNVTGLDTDGDGIPDSIDIDDDDDGIPDDQECVNAPVAAGGPNAITVDVGVNQQDSILDGINGGGNGARMNNTNDVLVLQLRAGDAIVPAGTLVVITSTVNNTTAKRLRFEQSDNGGNNTSNPWDAAYNSATSEDQNFTGSGNNQVFTVNYTLATDATHIKITMLERVNGRVNLDYLEYQAFNVCTSGDTDGDGIVDSLDIDSDNDGILDNIEAQTTVGYVAKSGVDNNNDGLDDAYNNFLGSGFNGIQTSQLINTDGSLTNSDTIPDYLDIDSDNDGIPDNIEAQTTLTYIAPNGVTKGNGMDSAYSFNDSFANTGLSSSLVNTDGDAQPDYRDIDADADGTNDDAEGLTGTPAFSGTDTDGDGLDDAFEHGSNNDGFIVNDGISDPKTSGIIDADTDVNSGGDLDYRDTLAGSDTDGDGIVDSVDIDDDNDGILDTVEGEVADFDGDGIPNSLDLDSDGDGILDIIESQPSTGAIVLSGNDADNDGLDDNFDATPNGNQDGSGSIGTIPVNTDNGVGFADGPDYLDIDADQDGIPDNVEAQTTIGYTTPTGNVGLNGVDSAYENNDTFNPTGVTIVNTDTNLNNNADTIPDYRDTDSDGDGALDADESGIKGIFDTVGTDADGDGLDNIYEGSDATAGEAYDVNDEIDDPKNNLTDADNDGSTTGDVDYRDIDVVLDNDGDGIIDSIDRDDDNDGILDFYEDNGDPNRDTDGDGIKNSFDIDADNDGIPDNIEAQTTLGYIAPNGVYDAFGVDTAYPASLTVINTDALINNNADTIPDYLDDDSDGDGILDILENGRANVVSGVDTDMDGLDNAFEGAQANDEDVNDEIDDPTTDLPDEDSDASNPYIDNGNGANDYNDVDYRDTDDDRSAAIAAGHVLWLRGDIDLAGATWEDQTGSGATKFDATLRNSPTINPSGANFNPSIVLNGSNQDAIINSGIFGNTSGGADDYNTLWIYAVSSRNSGDAHVFSHQVDGQVLNFEAPNGGNFTFNPGTGNNTNNTWGGTNSKYHLWNAGYDNNTGTPPSGQNTTQYRDGLELGTTNNNTGGFDGNGGNATIGSNLGSTYMNGQIAELMVYTSLPTSARQQQIQSYLAIKYGITLDMTNNDGSITEGDYLLEDLSTIVWDESANSSYHNDVAGIGRDDNMLLTQKQSKSINSDAVITIGLGNIASSNANNSSSINSNKSFLVWGNNNAALTNSTSKTLICAPEIQLDRVWKIVESGSIGTVQIAITEATVGSFNINTVLNTANTIKVLKVADDPTFSTNVKHLPLTSINIDGQNHLVANYDFNGTKYFTYAEINGIFWNGDSAAWNGGAGTSGAPSTIAADIDKVLVIDAETTLNNTSVINDANVECVWVKPNTKLVINDGHYLQFDEDLLLEGEIRLIGDAQLVQTHTGLSNVQGNGKLYRDQKAGVPNVYRYHYWTSPVVASLGNTSFTVSDVMKDGTTPTSENSAPQNITFTNSYDGAQTNPITISRAWIYSYFNGTTRDDWVHKGENGNINVGEGFIMKSTGRSPQNFTFVGTPNDGTISKTINGATASLVGNPYPSVIDTQKFIQDNSSVIDGTLYFWEHTGESSTTNVEDGHFKYGYIGGYSQRNEAMGVAANSITVGTPGLGDATYTAPPQYIAVGQGFYVSATASGGTFSFENSQRLYSANNHFFKGQSTKTAIPNFKLGFDYTNADEAKIHRQLGINFKEGNTFAYESGYDSQTFDLQDTDVFWDFSEIETSLIIAGVGAIDAQLQIPIGLKIDTDKPVIISIDDKENMDGYNIYLVDLLTGQIFNLETAKELNLSKGTYTDRFALIFGGSALGVDDQEILNKILVYTDNSNNDIVIKNNNNQTIKKVELYNLLGQKVKEWKKLDQNFETRLSTSELSSAVYLIKLSTDTGNISKKVILK
jgi:hypothetical protein